MHWYILAVSLLCRAALSSGDVCCPNQCCSALVLGHSTYVCSALVLGHCTPVRRAKLHGCICSDILPAVSLFCRAALSSGDACCPNQCCSALVLSHFTYVCSALMLGHFTYVCSALVLDHFTAVGTAILHSFTCCDTSQLSAGFAEQH